MTHEIINENPRSELWCGDVLEVLKTLPDESIDCMITSPPYWALRDYQTEPIIWGGDEKCEHKWGEKNITLRHKAGETNPGKEGWYKDKGASNDKGSNFCSLCNAWRGSLGLEPTFQLYLEHLWQIFDEVKRILKKTGTCWVNIGDTYWGGGQGGNTWGNCKQIIGTENYGHKAKGKDYLNKSLCQIPSRFSIGMTDRGWILRNELIWHKPNCMPSSVKDRFTVDFEKVFFFVKSKEKSNDIKEWLLNKLKSEEAAWLAAIIDGEGCIRIYQQNHKYYGADLFVVNTDKRIVDRCKQITNIGTIVKMTSKKGVEKQKQLWRWRVTSNEAISVIAEIYDYLIIKKEQAKLAIAIQKNNRNRNSIEEKKQLFKLCQKLNQGQTNISGLSEPNLNRFSGCEKYFFEQQYEPHKYYEIDAKRKDFNSPSPTIDKHLEIGQVGKTRHGRPRSEDYSPQGRNRRCVWDIPTQPFKGAHFAVFPEDLVEPMIKSGYPQFICKRCGKAREKIIETDYIKNRPSAGNDPRSKNKDRLADARGHGGWRGNNLLADRETIGYTNCGCNVGFFPGTTLDPFCGRGTVGVVAKKLNRNFIGIDLSPKYIEMSKRCINNTMKSLF